ncbi:MAG: tRNA pseudouridine(38-40) synthase TruA [Acetivibrio ethanolgignens]
MMRNIKLILEYDGSRYDGWQKQKGGKGQTIQDKIEEVLRKMTGEEIEVIGAARTEAGVHAYEQIANFKTDSPMKVYEMKHYLNRYLPRDIAVLEALEVPDRFHASFNAKSFKYEYKITTGEVASVFERKYNYYSFKPLDIGKMKKAAKHFIGKKDFKAFSDNKRMKKSTIREIYDIEVYGGVNEISIFIHGDDFWPHMARIIVGTLMETGYGNMEPAQIPVIIESLDREKAGPTAEARGLFLQEVLYAE